MKYLSILLGIIAICFQGWSDNTEQEIAALKAEIRALKQTVNQLQTRQNRISKHHNRLQKDNFSKVSGKNKSHIQKLSFNKSLREKYSQDSKTNQQEYFSKHYGFQKEPITLLLQQKNQNNKKRGSRQHVQINTLDPLEIIRRQVSDLKAQEERFLGDFANHMGLDFTNVSQQIESKWEGNQYQVLIKLTSPRTQKFDIHIRKGQLVIQQINQEQHENHSNNVISSSTSISSSSESIGLPSEVDQKSMKVHQRGGYLVITFDKKE